MGDISATPRNAFVGGAADKLRGLRDALDFVPINIPHVFDDNWNVKPHFTTEDVGKLLIGKAPEEVNEWSYGNAPMQVPPMSNVPQLKQGRAQGLADTTMLPFAEAAGVGKLVGRGLRSTANAAMNVGEDVSRRAFLQKTGGAAAGLGAAAAVPPLIRKAMRTAEVDVAKDAPLAAAAKEAAPMAARAVARASPAEFFMAVRQHNHAAAAERRALLEEHTKAIQPVIRDEEKKWLQTPEGKKHAEWRKNASDEDLERFDEVLTWQDIAGKEHTARSRQMIDDHEAAYGELGYKHKEAYDKILERPEHKGYMSKEQEYELYMDRMGGDKKVEDYRRSLGILPSRSDDYTEIIDHIRKHGKYTDVERGVEAHFQPGTEYVEWFSPHTGQIGSWPHHVDDDPFAKPTYTYKTAKAKEDAEREAFRKKYNYAKDWNVDKPY